MACSSLQGGLLLHFPPKTGRAAAAAAAAVKNRGFGLRRCGGTRSTRKSTAAAVSSSTGDLRPSMDENPEGIISGEWPDNFSLLSYDDLRAYLETQILTDDKIKPSALLGVVMSTPVRVATADQTLEVIGHHFENVSGLPVVDGELRCIGIVSKSDTEKASNGQLKLKVGEFMSSPAISLSPDNTVLDAAALMLKKKIHRIPILNERGEVVGIVTRTDVFQVLEAVEV